MLQLFTAREHQWHNGPHCLSSSRCPHRQPDTNLVEAEPNCEKRETVRALSELTGRRMTGSTQRQDKPPLFEAQHRVRKAQLYYHRPLRDFARLRH